jgi:hypothetical protein
VAKQKREYQAGKRKGSEIEAKEEEEMSEANKESESQKRGRIKRTRDDDGRGGENLGKVGQARLANLNWPIKRRCPGGFCDGTVRYSYSLIPNRRG